MPLIVMPGQLARRSEIYRQLSQMLSVGVPIIKSLETVARNCPVKFRKCLSEMAVRLSQGETVGDVWSLFGDEASKFDIALIKAAEHSGRLDAVFKLLADHYLAKSQMLRRILSELAYPVFVFHFAVVLIPFITWFSDMNTPMLLLRVFGVLLPVYALVFLLIQASGENKGEGWRLAFEKFTRRIPLLGSGRHCLALSRLALTLQALLNAGVDVITSWEMAAAASGSPMIYETVQTWKRPIAAGLMPSEAINSAPGQFPEVFANLYHSGEVSGKLDDSLLRLHDYYEDQGNNKIHILSKWIPMFGLICVAVMVAIKVIGFWTGYFQQLNDVMK